MSEKHPACIADRIKLYINAILDGIKCDKATRIQADALYQELRGDIFLNGQHPKSVAAAIVYIASILAEDYDITQVAIGNAAHCSTLSIRYMSDAMGVYLGLIYSVERIRAYNLWKHPPIRDKPYEPPSSRLGDALSP